MVISNMTEMHSSEASLAALVCRKKLEITLMYIPLLKGKGKCASWKNGSFAYRHSHALQQQVAKWAEIVKKKHCVVGEIGGER